jgi:hypothetical protein
LKRNHPWWSIVSKVSEGLKFLKDLATAGKALSDADYKLKIADLTTTLADVKTTLTEAQAEIASKNETIEQLKKLNRRVKDDLIEYKGYLYRKQPSDGSKPTGSPFCAVCLEKHGLLFETSKSDTLGRPLVCPHCHTHYQHVSTFRVLQSLG